MSKLHVEQLLYQHTEHLLKQDSLEHRLILTRSASLSG
jgi:hypothetical protein